ncbi:MAG: hypothetical protein U0637_11725 [Phycisphaerales bacterium]
MRIPVLTAVASCVCCGVAVGQTSLVDSVSEARFLSALYQTPLATQSFSAPTVAAWDAAGRHAVTNTGVMPANPVVPMDHVEAWCSFEQAGAGSLLRSYTRASGYYMDGGTDGLGTFAMTTIDVRNRITVTNNSGQAVRVEILELSHGTVMTGGFSAPMQADAREELTVLGVGTDPFSYFEHSSAHVYAPEHTPRVELNGAWQTQSSPITATIPDLAGTLDGVEVHALNVISLFTLAAGGTRDFDVTFQGAYRSMVTGGFLGFAQTDFSGTGTMDYRGVDPVSGQPVAGVSFEVVGVPAPAGVCVVIAAALRGGRRRR